MQLYIKQSGNKYFVYKNDNPESILKGAWESKWWTRKCKLYDNNGNLSIEVGNTFRYDFWRMKFQVKIPILNLDNNIVPVKLFKGHWRLTHRADTYDFYLYQGHKKSLFKNDIQIASYDKKMVHLFGSDSFCIETNDNEIIELILAFELCFDLGKDNDNASVTFDLGNISKGIKNYNPNWKANIR